MATRNAESRGDVHAALFQRATLFFLLVAIAFSTGCVTTLTADEFEAEKKDGRMLSADWWYYCGSEDGYDYLWNNRMLHSNHYRIIESQSPVTSRFAYTHDRDQWVLQPWSIPYGPAKPLELPTASTDLLFTPSAERLMQGEYLP